MFEDKTFVKIMDEMLEWVPRGIDRQEGSIVFDALAPAALAIANMYADIASVYDETFADTASYPMLKKRAWERGLKPYPATSAVCTAEIVFKDGASAPDDFIGTRFSVGKLYFKVTDHQWGDIYTLECETTGRINILENETLIPVAYLENLQYARVIDCESGGTDEENVENFRRRYIQSLNAESYGGNIDR